MVRYVTCEVCTHGTNKCRERPKRLWWINKQNFGEETNRAMTKSVLANLLQRCPRDRTRSAWDSRCCRLFIRLPQSSWWVHSSLSSPPPPHSDAKVHIFTSAQRTGLSYQIWMDFLGWRIEGCLHETVQRRLLGKQQLVSDLVDYWSLNRVDQSPVSPRSVFVGWLKWCRGDW